MCIRNGIQYRGGEGRGRRTSSLTKESHCCVEEKERKEVEKVGELGSGNPGRRSLSERAWPCSVIIQPMIVIT